MEVRTNDQKVLNTFEGSNAVLDFLNPDTAPYTPLVEIPNHLNPYRKNGVRIFAKLMSTLPLANIKSLPAYNMLLDLKEKSETGASSSGSSSNLEPLPDTLIENSSGNTVFSLAVIARLMGIPKTKAVVSHEVSPGKLNILRFLGTEVIVNEEPLCPDPSDPSSGIYKAKVWSKENNWFNPGQYDNKANPHAHYKWTGPQIWEQTKGKISLLATGLGTTGSVVGIGSFLKEKNKNVEILGVSRAANNPVPGVRTKNLLREIAFDWRSVLDYQEEVGTVEAFQTSMDLCRAGLFVGPSSGFALVGLLKHLSRQNLLAKDPTEKDQRGLAGQIDEPQEKIAVFVCPDSPFPYIDEYFEYLDPNCFPKIENQQLLKNSLTRHSDFDKAFGTQQTSEARTEIAELTPQEVFDLVFKDGTKSNNSKDKFTLIDVRNAGECEDHHIEGSLHIPFYNLDEFLIKNKRRFAEKEAVIFICRHGNTSRIASYKAEQLGIKSISLKGGMTEWSRLDLPRVRSGKCVPNRSFF